MNGEKYLGMTRDEILWVGLDTSRGYFGMAGTGAYRYGRPISEIRNEAAGEVQAGDYDYLQKEGILSNVSVQEFRDRFEPDLAEIEANNSWVGEDDLYHTIGSGGQIQMGLKAKDVIVLAPGITHRDVETVLRLWNKYQLKPLTQVPKADLAKLEAILSRLPENPTEDDLRPPRRE
jgi:hypothetical protein